MNAADKAMLPAIESGMPPSTARDILAAEVRYLRAQIDVMKAEAGILEQDYKRNLTKLAAMERENAEYLDCLRHTHKAKYVTVGDKDILTEECDECGRNLCHKIHWNCRRRSRERY